MPECRTEVALRHMLDSAKEARAFIQGKSQSDLESNRMLSLATTRLMEIIGEAGNRIPSEERLLYPEIPWSQIIGMRNRLIHGYDLVDFDVLWQTVIEDLPPLIEAIEKILSSED
jgi:uncharacterized protein with HEPN domain